MKRQFLSIILALLLFASNAFAGVKFFSGFETGDFSEWSFTSGSVVTSPTTNGGYSAKFVASGGVGQFINLLPALNLPTAFNRFNFWLDSVTNSTSIEIFVWNSVSGNSKIASLQISVDGSGNPSIVLFNNVTSAQIGSFAISKQKWLTIESKVVVSATVGILELKVNGTVAATGSSLNTGTNNVGSTTVDGYTLTGTPNMTVYHDDHMIRDDAYPGPGYSIARQGIAGTPTNDAWTKNGAATSALAWSNTPFNATTNCSNIGLSNAQTMLMGLFNAKGSTAEGAGILGPTDTINAAKTAFIAKATVAGNISIRRRIGGANTDTVKAVTTTDAYYDDGIWSPTYANLTGSTPEIGAVDDVAGVTDTVEDEWEMIDYRPAPHWFMP